MNYEIDGQDYFCSPDPIPHGVHADILFPLQTPEQSENTLLFLTELVANTYNTPYHCLIMRQRVLRRDTYVRYWDKKQGRWQYVYEDDAQTIKCIKGRKGIDWGSPALYEVAKYDELLREHHYAYQRKVTRKGQTEWIDDPRPPLVDAIADSDETTKYLFYGVLVKKRPLCERHYTSDGIPTYRPRNYATGDVAAGRCVWVDVDGHNLPLEEIKRLNPIAIDHFMERLPVYCAQTGVPMPAVVNSGRGVHLYWWFNNAEDLRAPEAQRKFKCLLNKMNEWATKLIAQDEMCSKAWKTDSASSAVFHQMNLPGCIHPKTLSPRYVVNRYGQDYFRCAYAELCKTLDVCDEPIMVVPDEQNDAPAGLIPEIHAGKNDVPEQAVQEDLTDAQTPSPGRLIGLMEWAERRNWDLYPGRQNFLLVCGSLIQQYTKGQRIPEANHPLFEINNKLIEPLPRNEVEHLIEELNDKATTGHDPFSSYYLYTYQYIPVFLKMTEEETLRFRQRRYIGKYSSKPDFTTKLREIMVAEDWHAESETWAQFRQRCYRLTETWFENTRTCTDRNGARTRKRAAQEGYNPKGGRRKVNHTVEYEKCLALQAQGLSVRAIAEEVGISKSKVGRLLQQ